MLPPFAEVSSLVALNFEGQPTVVVVIYADRLSPDEVFDRLEYCRAFPRPT